MKQKKFKLYVDTGGTFTDCIAVDENGTYSRRKVLSNGTIRGNIIEWIDTKSIRIDEKWKLDDDILAGYQFKLLNEDHPCIKVKSYNLSKKLLQLDTAIPEIFYGREIGFELSTGEEAPVFGARLITRSSLDAVLPLSEIRLGSTKGTNALLERKGSKVVFFVTKSNDLSL